MSSTRKIGKYIVLQTLGEGGFSKVKLGEHEESHERVALKLLKKNALVGSTSKQVEREISAMSRVNHRNIIKLVEVDYNAKYTSRDGRTQDIILIVLELATGGELFDFLSFTGSFDEVVARSYFHQLVAGLDHCHSHGVAHRDLKPENLLLDSDFVLKIADFGLSGLFSANERLMYTECGTPSYMSPEMSKSNGYDGVAADIWSAGVILFIMVAGFPPFARPHMSDWWFNKLATGKAHLFWQAHCRNATFSDEFKDLIERMLIVDPAKRATISDVAHHAWFKGPKMSDDQLYAELASRKRQVDEIKNREKHEKKIQNCGVEKTVDEATNAIFGEAVRDTDEELPTLVPQYHYREKKIDFSDFNDDEDVGTKEQKGEAPLYPGDAVPCYTQFRSKVSPAEALKRVEDTLAGFEGRFKVDGPNYRARAQITMAVGAVTMAVQVYRDAEDKTLLECRRLKGDSIQYRSVYFKLRSLLSDIAAEQSL